jgi:hypothetical protein
MDYLAQVLETIDIAQRPAFAKLLANIPADAWIASLDEIAAFEIQAKSFAVILTPEDWALQEKIARAITEPYQWNPTSPTAQLYADALNLNP